MNISTAPRRVGAIWSAPVFPSFRCSITRMLIVLACLLSVGLSSASAQTNNRVLHVWVDPHYGDDTLAPLLNPTVGTYCTQTIANAIDFVDISNGKPLLHNAWPYRTVTAAIASIPPLPYTSIKSGFTWKYAVIHCLPGMYATGITTIFPLDTVTGRRHYIDNGLPANGEVFPIRLPDRVSLQGTSALNTIFHLEDRGALGNQAGVSAFVFGQASGPGLGDAYTGADTFIDSISIVGTHYEANRSGTPGAMAASAIYLGKEVACSPTLTNCWIYGNTSGLTLDAPDDGSPPWHTPVVINNSFIWNRVGIWNGQSNNALSIGLSRPILVNNVFDASIPRDTTFRYPAGWSTAPVTAFEGIAIQDLTVVSPGLGGDFNAYEANSALLGTPGAGGYNAGRLAFAVVGLGGTNVDTALGTRASPAAPGINISPWTGNLFVSSTNAPDGARGVLFIRDLIYNGSFITNNSAFDQSPADFRLSPSVALGARLKANTRNANAPSALNPLVDRGFSVLPSGLVYPILMGNGQSLANTPGHLSAKDNLGNETWIFDSWDEDCEGFGNPRIWDHPHYPTPTGGTGDIDIGGDELGGLVVGGYRFASTNFFNQTTNLPLGTKPMDNKYFWYFGPAGFTLPSSALHPSYSAVVPGPPPLPWRGAWTFGTPALYYSPTQMDISPYLFGDIHPYWGVNQASNCNWQFCLTGWPYNQALFLDSGYGVINPPGSYPTLSATYVWIDIVGSQAKLFKLVKTTNAVNVGYDSWCRAMSSNTPAVTMHTFPTTVVGGSIWAYRYSIEESAAGPSWASSLGNRNLQSFMVRVK